MAPIGLSVQVVASPTIVIQMTLEVSFMLLENIYSTGITHVDRHLQLSHFYSTSPCGQCYKDITIVNDTIGLSVQVVASPTIIIQMTLEVSCMLQENIYGTEITHADRHLQLSHFYCTGPCGLYYKDTTIVNDTYRVVSTSCQYDHHSDDPRSVMYAPRKHLQYRHHSCRSSFTVVIFL